MDNLLYDNIADLKKPIVVEENTNVAMDVEPASGIEQAAPVQPTGSLQDARAAKQATLDMLKSMNASPNIIKHAQEELESIPASPKPTQKLKDIGQSIQLLAEQVEWNAREDAKDKAKVDRARKTMDDATQAYELIQQTTNVEAERRAKIELELRASIQKMHAPVPKPDATNQGEQLEPAAQLLEMAGTNPGRKAQAQEVITLLQTERFPDNMLDLLVDMMRGGQLQPGQVGELPATGASERSQAEETPVDAQATGGKGKGSSAGSAKVDQ